MKRSSRLLSLIVTILMVFTIFGPLTGVQAWNYSNDTELNTVDGSYLGEATDDFNGFKVDIVGDVDGDGLEDILITSWGFDSPSETWNGKVYLLLGDKAGFGTNYNITWANASWYGTNSNDNVGFDIDGLGDVNGDGYDDFIIGAYGATGGATLSGKSYIIFGKKSGWASDTDISNADVILNGEKNGDRSGYSVAGAGDVNGDGYNDILIGAYQSDTGATNAGEVYLVFGRETGWPGSGDDLDDANASFVGTYLGEMIGTEVAGAGDVNNDGFDDILIGAQFNDDNGNDAGKAYLIMGKADEWTKDQDVSSASTASYEGYSMGDKLGSCLSTAEDMNNDGYDDFLIGAYNGKGKVDNSGLVYMFLGMSSDWSKNKNVSAADVKYLGEAAFDSTGWQGTCSNAGDVNGDLYDDVIIGSKGNDEHGQNTGQAYLMLGTSNFASQGQALDGVSAVSFYSNQVSANAGSGVAGGGDLDGDGYDDLVISAPNYNQFYNDRGKTYIVLPDTNSYPQTITSIKFYTSTSYNKVADSASLDDVLFIELIGDTGNSFSRDMAVAIVNTSIADRMGIKTWLYETGTNTGIYRGSVSLQDRSRENDRWIAVVGNETLKVRSFTNKAKSHSIFVLGNLMVKPNITISPSVNEDQFYKKHFWAEGAPSFTWSLSTDADWLDWSGSNTTVLGTPDNSHVGDFYVNVTVDDDYNQQASLNYTLTVMNVDPEITATGIPNAIEDHAYGIDLNSTDDGQGAITWSLEDESWLSIGQANGDLTGTPTNIDVGTNWANVTVYDGNGGSHTVNFTLDVINTNDPPVIQTSPVDKAMEDEQYQVDYLALDVDPDDTLTWMIKTNTSDWLKMDTDTGILSGTPLNKDVGTYWVNVTVTDELGATDHDNFTLKVENVNDPPKIISTPIVEATALISYSYQVEVADIDVGAEFEYWLDVNPDGMGIDKVTGEISWIPTRDQGGDHQVAVGVTDGSDNDGQTFTVTVTVPSHYPPLVTLLSPADGSEMNITNPKLTWSSEDPDSTVVYFDVFLGTDQGQVTGKAQSVKVANDITQTVFIPKTELEKGKTYYWTIDSFDGQYKGDPPAGVWSFSILKEAVATKEPTAVLNLPLDGDLLETTPVQLEWSGADPDSKIIYYDLYMGKSIETVEAKNPSVRKLKDSTKSSYLAEALTRGLTYYWTVIPNDGENIGTTSSGIWSFNVADVVIRNNPPVFNSTPVTEAFVSQGYQYQVIAIDPDVGDSLSFSLIVRPTGMVIDSESGLIVWNPTDSHIGAHEVAIRVSDGKVHVDQNFEVEVKPLSAMNNKPIILDKTPPEAKVGKEYDFRVEATDVDIDDSIQFSLVNGPDGMVIDPASGIITWKPAKDQEGENIFTISVSDGEDQVEKEFTVDVKGIPPVETKSALETYLPLLLLLVIIMVVVGIVVASRKRSKRDELAKAVEEDASGPEVEDGQYGQSVGQSTPPVAPVPVVTEEGIEDFKIKEVLLIYNDGRLIANSSIDDEDSIDKELMSGMLVAIQGFVTTSFETQGGLDSFEFGGNKVILQGGQYLVLAVVLEGTEPEVLREEIMATITKIEGLYAGVIEGWDGRSDTFEGVRQYLLPLFKLRSTMKIKAKKKHVRVKSGIEFYSGFVRLKVGVSNGLDDIIRDITLTLDYDHSTLKLSHIEPEYPRSGTAIYLPDVHPAEKRTVAIYFDPVICQESHIDGWVTFTDQDGNQLESRMKRRPVDIVCPIFYTTETVNVAMLKRLLKELNYNDSRIFMAMDAESLKEGYDLAVSAVRAHDVKFVREFKEDDPYGAESWFYGEVKEAEENLVIKVSASMDLEFLEIFVASSNLASMTGLLAELSNVFRKKLGEMGLKESLTVQSEQGIKDVVKQTRLLLDKFADTEMDAGEIDQE